MTTEKTQPLTSGLASGGVYARGKFCGNLKVLHPPEHQATKTLGASGESAIDFCLKTDNPSTVQDEKFAKNKSHVTFCQVVYLNIKWH